MVRFMREESWEQVMDLRDQEIYLGQLEAHSAWSVADLARREGWNEVTSKGMGGA